MLSNADPKRTYLKLVDRTELPAEFVADIEAIQIDVAGHEDQSRAGGAAAIRRAGERSNASAHTGGVFIGPSIDYLQRAYEDGRNGRPADYPFFSIHTQSAVDPTVAPEGKHTLSIFTQYFPYDLAEGTWEERRDEIADHAIRRFAEYAPNIADAVIARQVLAPPDIEARFGLTGGHIFQGELVPEQAFDLRPVPGSTKLRRTDSRSLSLRLRRLAGRLRDGRARSQRRARSDRQPQDGPARIGNSHNGTGNAVGLPRPSPKGRRSSYTGPKRRRCAMAHERQLATFIDEVQRLKLTRRSALRRAAALGLSTAAIAAHLPAAQRSVGAQEKAKVRLSTWAGVDEAKELQAVIDKVNAGGDRRSRSSPNRTPPTTTQVPDDDRRRQRRRSLLAVAGVRCRLCRSGGVARHHRPSGGRPESGGQPRRLLPLGAPDRAVSRQNLRSALDRPAGRALLQPRSLQRRRRQPPDDTWTWDNFTQAAAQLTTETRVSTARVSTTGRRSRCSSGRPAAR